MTKIVIGGLGPDTNARVLFFSFCHEMIDEHGKPDRSLFSRTDNLTTCTPREGPGTHAQVTIRLRLSVCHQSMSK